MTAYGRGRSKGESQISWLSGLRSDGNDLTGEELVGRKVTGSVCQWDKLIKLLWIWLAVFWYVGERSEPENRFELYPNIPGFYARDFCCDNLGWA